jgi:hypothetical protein
VRKGDTERVDFATRADLTGCLRGLVILMAERLTKDLEASALTTQLLIDDPRCLAVVVSMPVRRIIGVEQV